MKKKVFLLTSFFALSMSQAVFSAPLSVNCTEASWSFSFKVSEDWSHVVDYFTLPCKSVDGSKTVSCTGVITEGNNGFANMKLPGVFTKEADGSFNFKFLPMSWTFLDEANKTFPDDVVQALMEEASDRHTSLKFTCKVNVL